MGRKQPKSQGAREQQHQQVIRPPLPSDTLKVAGSGNRCENIGLWLDRYLPVNERWELTQDAKQRRRIFQLTGQQRVREIVNALKLRQEALLQWYGKRGFEVRQFNAKPVWRFVVGLGAAHVLETGITLHRLFGLPIIPASGLKGAARAYALYELATELGVPILSPNEAEELNSRKEETPLQKLEKLAAVLVTETEKQKAAFDEILKDKRLPADAQIRKLDLETLRSKLLPFTEVFGTTEQAGKIVFLDAIPLEAPTFTLDIMNPHYPEYYRTQGGQSPSDWQSPNPVFFLTVSETLYLFAIAARTKDSVSLLATAEGWLKGALKELGIGAKTSAYYGYWNEVSQ